MADGEYNGTEFFVTRYWKFRVPELDREFGDYQSMQTAIDNKCKELASSRREKMSIPCVDMGGNKVTLTGIHAAHGGFVSKPAVESHSCKIYPDCHLVLETMRAVDEATARLNHIKAALESLSVRKFDPGYGRDKKELVHQDEVARVKKELAAIVSRCEQVGSIESLLLETKVERDTKRKIRL
jgi:hypothetical protein